MDITKSPRHTRRGWSRAIACAPITLAAVEPRAVFVVPDTVSPAGVPAVESRRRSQRFLSWLADEITGQAGSAVATMTATSLCHRDTARRILDSIDNAGEKHSYSDEAAGLIASLREAISLDSLKPADVDPGEGEWDFDVDDCFVVDSDYEFSCLTAPDVDLGSEQPLAAEYAIALRSRTRQRPQVEISPDGQRLEIFEGGSRIVKDVLGRVVEVRSQHGDCLYLQYGPFGKLDSFARTDSRGRPHSLGRVEKYSVVVRDGEGRVRATGESMTVDPRGRFYLHALDGQFFSLDLVSGIHCERRRMPAGSGSAKYITALFAYDGFRMATMFARQTPVPAEESLWDDDGATYGEARETQLAFRFYGRDGSLIEFESENDLRELNPCRVMPPGSKPVHSSWLKNRQASTAWQAVLEYLTRVS